MKLKNCVMKQKIVIGIVTIKKGITDEKEPERYIKISYEIDA